MATVHDNVVTSKSHPYRPELSLLRIFLAGQGYTENARETIVSFAAREGTLEGGTRNWSRGTRRSRTVFCDGMEAVPPCSPSWDEHATSPEGAPVYIDLDTLIEGGSTANLLAAVAGSYLDNLTDEQIDALSAELAVEEDDLVEPITSDAPDAGRSWSEHMAELIATGRTRALPAISGGSAVPADGRRPGRDARLVPTRWTRGTPPAASWMPATRCTATNDPTRPRPGRAVRYRAGAFTSTARG